MDGSQGDQMILFKKLQKFTNLVTVIGVYMDGSLHGREFTWTEVYMDGSQGDQMILFKKLQKFANLVTVIGVYMDGSLHGREFTWTGVYMDGSQCDCLQSAKKLFLKKLFYLHIFLKKLLTSSLGCNFKCNLDFSAI
jgi:hypothetical protein